MAERIVREFPIRSVYFTPLEVQNIIAKMDGYLRLAFSTEPSETEIADINDEIWNTMKRAYQSLTEDV
jgi:hypothetical protein